MLPATCSSCHQTIPAQPSLGGYADQVAFIHDETRRMDELIALLNEERAALLRRLNAIQSPTITLPAETLSSIFEYACPPPDLSERHTFPRYTEDDLMELPEYQYFQFTLGAVSSHWRQVVWSSPRLWAWVALDITTATVEEDAEFLQLFIENSKKIPFTIALNFLQDINPRSTHLVHKTVDKLLIGALPRIKELHLVNPPRQWHNYTPYLLHLRDCSLNLSRPESFIPDGRVILPSNAPLRRFSLQDALWRSDANIQLPWATLTWLNLSSIPGDLSVQVFIQCPNLIYFNCCSPSRLQPPPGQAILSRPVTFQYLTSFHWEAYDSPWGRALIRYLHVPALKEMSWNTFDTDNDNHDVKTFFGRLPPTLTMLTLSVTTCHLEYINDSSNIELLVLSHCLARDFRMLLHKLRPSQQEGQVVKPLPRLKKILCDEGIHSEYAMMGDNVLDSRCSDALVEILEQRLDESNNSFTLDTAMSPLPWTPGARARLGALVSRGFSVEILDGYEDDAF